VGTYIYGGDIIKAGGNLKWMKKIWEIALLCLR
jgi:hypothetical protein